MTEYKTKPEKRLETDYRNSEYKGKRRVSQISFQYRLRIEREEAKKKEDGKK